MGVDGVNIKVRNIWIKEGEDFSVITPDGVEVFVMFQGGRLTFNNETDDNYKNVGIESVMEPQTDGSWMVYRGDDPNELQLYDRTKWV